MADLTSYISAKDYQDGSTYNNWAPCTSNLTLTAGYRYSGSNWVMCLAVQMPENASAITLGFYTISGANGGVDSTIRYKVTTTADHSSYVNATAATGGDGDFLVNNPYARTELKISGSFQAGRTYYIYFWTAQGTGNTANLFRVRWMSNSSGTGFYASYTALNTYRLTIEAESGATVSVNRVSSQFAGTGKLSNGATLYASDVLTITFTAGASYSIETHTVNGTAFKSGSSHTVKGDVRIVATVQEMLFTLKLSVVTGASVRVLRGGVELENNTQINYGDVLTITFSTEEGYNLGVHTVNGKTFQSGASHTVTSDVTVAVTAILKTFQLSITNSVGIAVSVIRNGKQIQNQANITYGDVLTITFSAAAGYVAVTQTVNGEEFTSGETHKVMGNVEIVATAEEGKFTLTISQGVGTEITVTRNGEQLQDQQEITFGEQLEILFAPVTGYNITSQTVNQETVSSQVEITVGGDTVVTATARLNEYLLTVSASTGAVVTVRRTASGGGETGVLQSGAVLYHGDVLQITYGADEVYSLAEATMNGMALTTDSTHTVTGDVSVIVVYLIGVRPVYVDEGAAFGKYYEFIEDGATWEQYEGYVDTGTGWVCCE